MDPNSRAGGSVTTQLNWLMIISVLVPVLLIFGLGIWISASNAQPNTTALSGLPSKTTFVAIIVGSAIVSAVALAGVWLRLRSVVRTQALELAEVCRQAAGGDRTARAQIQGDDEFAVLSASINAMLDGGAAPTSLAALPSGGDAQDAATLQAQIEKLLQEVSAVGDGDLRVQAEVTPDTLGVLADSFNYMIEELAKVVGRVQATTFQVTNATRRLLDRSAEVAQASQAQALQISGTTESVSQLADFVQLSATNALAAAEAARGALRNAQDGQQAVVQTIDGMVHIRENVQETSKKIKRLGERSQEVGEIVRLIEDIADQTNLLALNAAIQSAMAGEHGRGFAVVADEIRLLAERVTEATKKIATIVKSIQGDTYEAVVAMEESTQEVVAGSRLADEAGESLRSIYSAVDRQAKMIEGIARAANDRAKTSEAVAQAMSSIADIAQQTTSATQDATQNVSYLAGLAEELRASVATFRLPEQITQQAMGALPQPAEAAYPPMLNLPNIGAPEWGASPDEMRQLPALPAGVPALPNGNGNGFDSGFDLDAYDDYFNNWQRNAGQAPQQGYADQQFNQGPMGGPPFSGDLY